MLTYFPCLRILVFSVISHTLPDGKVYSGRNQNELHRTTRNFIRNHRLEITSSIVEKGKEENYPTKKYEKVSFCADIFRKFYRKVSCLFQKDQSPGDSRLAIIEISAIAQNFLTITNFQL